MEGLTKFGPSGTRRCSGAVSFFLIKTLGVSVEGDTRGTWSDAGSGSLLPKILLQLNISAARSGAGAEKNVLDKLPRVKGSGLPAGDGGRGL